MVALGFHKGSSAAHWELTAGLEQQLLYNDNIAFGSREAQPVFGYILAPSLQAARKEGALEIGFDGLGDIRQYDDSRWDCENFKLSTDNSYRTKRSVFRLSGAYGSSCSYVQQLTDTGLAVPTVQSENYSVAPSWTWQWTARSQLIAEANYSETSYSASGADTGAVPFSGNKQYTLRSGGNHTWSPRLSLNGGLFYSNIKYTGFNDSTQDIYGAQVGANYLLARDWTLSLGGGPRWIDTQQDSSGPSGGRSSTQNLGSVANISVAYSDQLMHFSMGYSNSISPSALGQVLQTDSLFLNYSYEFARHVSLDVSGTVSRSQAAGGEATNLAGSNFDRDYLSASAYIVWEFERDWELRGGYRYQYQQYNQDQVAQSLVAKTSDSNTVMVFLSYTWDGIREAR